MLALIFPLTFAMILIVGIFAVAIIDYIDDRWFP